MTKVAKEVEDLRVPLAIISKQWFKSNNAIFSLSGYGKYAKFSSQYESQKVKKYGGIKVLRASGKLQKSLTSPSDRFAVNQILNKKILIVGTKVVSKNGAPYAIYLQNGTKSMPARPPVLFGNEQVAPSSTNNRIKIWEQTLLDYALKKSVSMGKITI